MYRSTVSGGPGGGGGRCIGAQYRGDRGEVGVGVSEYSIGGPGEGGGRCIGEQYRGDRGEVGVGVSEHIIGGTGGRWGWGIGAQYRGDRGMKNPLAHDLGRERLLSSKHGAGPVIYLHACC